ncbi:MAG: hypothetical protein AAB438_03050 [Patescibacteria group bacterium]
MLTIEVSIWVFVVTVLLFGVIIFILTTILIYGKIVGRKMLGTSDLPKLNFKVIFADEKSLLLETIEPEPRRFFVTAQVFNGKLIAGEMVRVAKNGESEKGFCKSIGCLPLVKIS